MIKNLKAYMKRRKVRKEQEYLIKYKFFLKTGMFLN